MIYKKDKQLYILSPERKTRAYQYPRIKTHPPHTLVVKRTPNVIILKVIYRRF